MNEYAEVQDIINKAIREARSLERPFGFELDLVASNHAKAVLRALGHEGNNR